MKYVKFILIVVFIAIITLPAKARNVWNVYAGGSLSHICETPLIGSDRSYGWGGGAFIGCGYELNFNSHWSITPQIELSYADNGATLSSREMDFFTNHNQWMRSISVNVPIMVSYRLKFTDTVGMRFAVGPYLQEALVGEKYINDTQKKRMSGNFSQRFNLGPMGEINVETGNHLSYLVRVQYPFLKEGWVKNTISLSIGLKYSF